MCGIAGWAGRPGEPGLLERMGAVLAHRGPDDRGQLVRADAGLAFRRLSIIDVAGGQQPIQNEDGTAAIVLNGEIYNHHELRRGLLERGHRLRTRSDVEVVLHLWEEEREGCLEHLRGMFALAIWDERERTLLLARDRVGKKPLYHCHLPDGTVVFGSEIKAILQHPDVRREPDLAAIDHYLTLQYVPSPLTAFRGIRRLPPGHWLRWRDGATEERRWWSLRYGPKHAEHEEELREELLRLLRESVAIRLESEVPLGAFLSGGVDSSAVVALAAEASPSRLKTFSIGFPAQAFDERPYARLVAERFGTDHHELEVGVGGGAPELIEDIVWHYDQPFGDSSAIPSFHVARITRRHVTVALSGDGGDESFAGYQRYELVTRAAPLFGMPAPLRPVMYLGIRAGSRVWGPRGRWIAEYRPGSGADAYLALMRHLSPGRKRWLYQHDALLALAAEPTPMSALVAGRRSDLLDAMLEADVNHYLPDDLLVKMDVATMAHSLEARSPFLDHRLMEFAARLPPRLLVRRGRGKHLLKRALRGLLPDEVLDRPKMGFRVPLAEWLRTGLRELLEDTLLDSRALGRGYFRPAAVREMVEAHHAGSDQHRRVLWDLLLLELWLRRFIDQVPAPPQAARAEPLGPRHASRSA
ncbi:MAG TPA: asparagine synthase (glutamine-hydrolyzing) [Candidatus Dormibacteraeota bacterium]|nr:asparagine synthase (glutamine-hydrolyzing) [Candidatus Dormibacteraeota bacterium]